ncbi:hypothetical protein PPL19_15970 [Pseudomonas psychrotolerans L19]|nr:hypothetical protein PPL19_15970 [Pseudomonas psychrotolerans L19]
MAETRELAKSSVLRQEINSLPPGLRTEKRLTPQGFVTGPYFGT